MKSAMDNINIKMVHDVTCSWCHIGHRNLISVLHSLGLLGERLVTYIPMELNPGLDDDGVVIGEHLAHRYGWNPEKQRAYRERLLAISESVGADINFENRTHYYNTHLAHRLILQAQFYGFQEIMYNQLMTAYHTEGVNISLPEVLVDVISDVGFKEKFLDDAIASERVTRIFESSRKRIDTYDIQSVPAFVINDKIVVRGSDKTEQLRSEIERIVDLD